MLNVFYDLRKCFYSFKNNFMPFVIQRLFCIFQPGISRVLGTKQAFLKMHPDVLDSFIRLD